MQYRQHQVTITKPFYMGVLEVTQAQYEAVMGVNPSSVKGKNAPVDMISWNDTVDFCEQLSLKTLQNVRLPTEAEWEYACRAGSQTPVNHPENGLGEGVQSGDNAAGPPPPVGQRKPNAWGLYGMFDEVSEWCADYAGDYPEGPIVDPQGPVFGRAHVLRDIWGPSDPDADFCAGRVFDQPDARKSGYGFRVVVVPRKRVDEAEVLVTKASVGVTLNPDGTGKAMIDFMVGSQVGASGKRMLPPQDEVESFVREYMGFCRGVDVWSRVSLVKSSEGFKFRGTAYFRRLDEFNDGLVFDTLHAVWTEDFRGVMVLKMAFSHRPAPTPPNLTDEELARKVEGVLAEWRLSQSHPSHWIMRSMKYSCSYKLPGGVGETHGFTKEADGSVLYTLDIPKGLHEIDMLMADAVYVRDCIKAGMKPVDDPSDLVFIEAFFGVKLPFVVRVTGDMKPQFDYAAEVKAAKKAYPEMAKRLGLEK